MQKVFPVVSAVALMGGFGLGVPMAKAQTNPQPAQGPGVGEIVVTAQRRSENIQQVPIAISAVSGQFLEARGINSIDSLGTIAPNLTIEHSPSTKTIAQIAIRGSVTINPAVTWEPAVGLYLNGVYIAKAAGSIFDVADLERVEVLRGPQGTLYGRNALAGAINLVPRAPSGKAGASAEVSYGNYNFRKIRAVVDLPAWGAFSLKLSGQIQLRDGFVKTVANPYPAAVLAGPNPVSDMGSLDSKSGMVQLRFKPEGSRFTADYMFDYTRYDQRPDFAQLYKLNANGDPRDIFTNPASPGYVGGFFPLGLYVNTARQNTASVDASPMFERSRTFGHALTMAFDTGAVTFKSITAYRNLHWSDSLDLDGSPLPVAQTARDIHFHSFSQELQASGKAFDKHLNYVAGLFYYNEGSDTSNPQQYFAGGSQIDSRFGAHTKAFAAFVQADYALTDRLKLTLGGRYTHEQKDISRYLAYGGVPSPVLNLPFGAVPDAKYDSFTPAVTLSYQPQRNFNFYARFAQGFKSGGFNGETNVVQAPTSSCRSGAVELCSPYRPEKVDSYELGAKTRWLDGKLIVNLAAFWDEHKDIQLSVFTAGSSAASLVLNAAKARVRGLEVEVVARPADWLTINGSLATLDPTYKSYIDGGVDVSGNRAFPHAPHLTAALGGDLRLAKGDWGNFHLIGDLSHISSYYTYPYALTSAAASDQVAATSRASARTIINMRASVLDIPLGGMVGQVTLWVKNLTNYTKPVNFIDFGPGFGGLTVAYFADPRTYGASLGVKF